MVRLCTETNCVWLWKTWLLLDCFLFIRPCHKIILLTRHLCSQIVIYKFVNTIWKLSATDSFNKEDKIVQDFYMWNLFVSLEKYVKYENTFFYYLWFSSGLTLLNFEMFFRAWVKWKRKVYAAHKKESLIYLRNKLYYYSLFKTVTANITSSNFLNNHSYQKL